MQDYQKEEFYGEGGYFFFNKDLIEEVTESGAEHYIVKALSSLYVPKFGDAYQSDMPNVQHLSYEKFERLIRLNMARKIISGDKDFIAMIRIVLTHVLDCHHIKSVPELLEKMPQHWWRHEMAAFYA